MSNVRRKLMASTIVVGALNLTGFAASALAQTAPADTAMATQKQPDQSLPQGAAPKDLADAPPSAPPAVAEVVVTGSLIRQPNLTSTSPQTTVTNEEFKLQGATNVEDVLNSLPSVFASESEGVSNGATGTASVDLRGLGDKRTLVLIDGKRVGTGDVGDNGAVDLNIIPSALIQRVDVVTGGESAVYGSDAISGVVNFIMQHNFQGVRLDGNFDDFEHGNGNSYLDGLQSAAGFTSPTGTWSGGERIDVTAIVGVNTPDDKGNVTAYVGFRNIQPVTQDKLDYSACALAESGSGFACSGSGTTSSARFITSSGADLYVDPKTNALRAYNSATDAYNYAPYNYYQRPDTRYTSGFFAHYEVNPKVDVYADFMFMDDSTTAQIAPSGLFGSTFTLPCSNPQLTASEVSQLCGGSTTGSFTSNILRRNIEGGSRDYILHHDEYREVVGARGDLDNAWHYDVYGEYSQSNVSDEFTGDISLSKATAALSGCSSSYAAASTLVGCVPYNIYTAGGVTSAATQYIESDAFESSTITQQVVNATLNGDLGKYGLRSPLG
ncbi:MAG: TonB-dependent receptor plug domain-containing protein, partial [Caulobacteraceae bacterium]